MRWPGRSTEELFPRSTILGEIIGSALRSGRSIEEQPVTIPRAGMAPLRLVVSVQLLKNRSGQEDMGTLVTLRDVESRRQLEQQLDFSSRLAAISRLTGGVAHEIKNPLNAMALHLEVLKGKLDGEQPEIEVIGREIKRLDTVVKTFLNFNRPVDLNYRPIDFNDLVKQVLALVSVDANAKNVALKTVLQADTAVDHRRSRSAEAGHSERDQQRAGSHDGRRNADHQNDQRWRPVPAHGERRGAWNRARDPEPRVPALLHDQRDRLRDRSCHNIPSGPIAQWYNRLYQRAWKGHHVPVALSENGRLPG